MATNYATPMHRWFDEVWNKKRVETIDELLSEDSIHHGLGGPGQGPVMGSAGFKQFHAEFVRAFPDCHIEVDELLNQNDTYAVRFTVTGTQTGPLLGSPPTGKKVKFTGGSMCKFRDGKFVEVWNEVDFPKMQYDLADDTPDIE